MMSAGTTSGARPNGVGATRPLRASTAVMTPAAHPMSTSRPTSRIAEASTEQAGPRDEHVRPLTTQERLGREIAEPATASDEQRPRQRHRQESRLSDCGDVRFSEHPGDDHASEDECGETDRAAAIAGARTLRAARTAATAMRAAAVTTKNTIVARSVAFSSAADVRAGVDHGKMASK